MAEYKWDPSQYVRKGATEDAAKKQALADRAAAMRRWRKEGFYVEVWTVPANQTSLSRSVYCLTVT